MKLAAPPSAPALAPLALYVVNSSSGAPLFVDVLDANKELRPQIQEGAANAKGPYSWTKPDEEQLVGYFDNGGGGGDLGHAVFLYPAQRGEASFERINIPAGTARAVIYFDGSREHVKLTLGDSKRAPRIMQWVYLAASALVVAGLVAFVLYKSFASKRERRRL